MIFLQPTKKKPFIERHNSTTYRLVYRSHKDPLVIDGESSTHVLSPVGDGRNSRPLLGCAQAKVETSSEFEGTRTKGDSGIGAPGPLFGSRPGGENDLTVGANKFSTPQVDLNPDTIASWGGNLDFLGTEDLLEDDFVQLANRHHMHDSNVDAQGKSSMTLSLVNPPFSLCSSCDSGTLIDFESGIVPFCASSCPSVLARMTKLYLISTRRKHTVLAPSCQVVMSNLLFLF
ncbi:hypothetical protein QAD02_013253 [Eretmocerus hayati]|uniref:Uncharacterized protein n=1 Tax=Eretmocerus hayati TaxID=131215 RepID=A0ACC2P214_9HYME|nr:hypothetical protein QAD02_013253 [Eretmocerus hayati]